MSLAAARDKIKPTTNTIKMRYEDAGVPEILELIFKASQYGPAFTAKFSPSLRGRDKKESAKNVWRFVRENVKYQRDPAGRETVKSPGKLIYDGVGDCKSFTVLVVSILTNLGIPWRYRVAFYDPKQPNAGHIYPVAIIGGTDVIVDAVHDTFNEEVEYWTAYDYDQGGKQIRKMDGGTLAGPAVTNFKNIAIAGLLVFAATRF